MTVVPDPASITQVLLRAGGVTILHPLALHAAVANTTGQPCRLVAYQYRADDSYHSADDVRADTGLQIAGRNRGIVRCDASVLRLPRRPDGSFGSAYHQTGARVQALSD
jgi:hypothetical protein